MTSASRSERTVGHGPRAGTTFPVEVATHVTGVLVHASGALSTLVMSFDVWVAGLPHIEIYGTEGSLSVPDPNHFDGPVRLFLAGAETKDFGDVPVRGGYPGAERGYGIADLAATHASDTPHRADGCLAYHVLEVMEALLAAAEAGQPVHITSTPCGPLPYRRTRAGRSPRTPAADTEEAKEHSS
jgi:predicted dehydrogenase